MLALLALLPLHIYNYIAFLFILITLISTVVQPGLRRETGWSWIGWMFIPFAIGLVGWITSGTHEKTLNFIGMYGVIAVWPLLLGVTQRFRRPEWDDVFFRIFIGSTVLAILFYNAQLVYKFIAFNDQFETLRQQHDLSFIYRTSFSKVSGIHPTYFSIWTWLAVGLIGFRYRSEWKLYLIPLFVLLVEGFLLNSRMPFIAFFISFLPSVFRFLKTRQRLIVLFTAGVLIVLFGLSRFGELRNAFDMSQLNSVSIRWQVWDCASSVISDGGWTGVGTGNGNAELYACYEQNAYDQAFEQRLNAHNMYLHFFMENGWWGGILFLLFIGGLVFRFAKLRNAQIGIWFVLFFAICMMTENLFHRQPAVATFGMFIAIFAFAKNKKEV